MQVTYIRYYIYENMGASQGKSKKEQKEEARRWAENKDNEVATLYGENTKLMNEMRLLQVDFQAMKRTMEQEYRQRQAEQLKTLQAYEEALKQQKEETEAVKQEMADLKQKLKGIATNSLKLCPQIKLDKIKGDDAEADCYAAGECGFCTGFDPMNSSQGVAFEVMRMAIKL